MENKRYNLYLDVINEIEENADENLIDIVIIPSERVDVVTDNESTNDEDTNTFSDNQLNKEISCQVEVINKDFDDIEDELFCWELNDYSNRSVSNRDPDISLEDGCDFYLDKFEPTIVAMDEREIFELFFDSNVLNLIIKESVTYAGQNNEIDFDIEKNELMNFIGILILSGYNRLPRQRMYWEEGMDCGVEAVKKCMSYKRFTQIKKYIHLCDNSLLSDDAYKNDRFFKVRNYMNILNKNFQRFGYFSRCLSIDEQMIPYFGHHSAKMCIKGKPIKFGFKCWCLCSYDGYVFSTDIYCGKGTNIDKKLGLGGSVVKNFVKLVEYPRLHEFYFDNFFTSVGLLNYLSSLNVKATGTVRQNRTLKCPFTCDTVFKKENRGFFESYNAKRCCQP